MNKTKEAYEKGYRCTKEGTVISHKNRSVGSINNEGYHYFTIRVMGKNRKVLSHRLQAYQKYGESLFDEGIEVRHVNSDRADFSWDNILIGTHSDNMMDQPEEVRKEKALKAFKARPIQYDKVSVLKHYDEFGWSKTLKKYKMSKGNLSYLINNR